VISGGVGESQKNRREGGKKNSVSEAARDLFSGLLLGRRARSAIAKRTSLVIAIPAYRFASAFYGRSQRIVKWTTLGRLPSAFMRAA